VDTTGTWVNSRENIKSFTTQCLGDYEVNEHKMWCDEECSKLLGQNKQDKFQWLDYSSQTNEDNLNNVTREISTGFTKRSMENVKQEINELDTNIEKKISGS
jgi:hypothetical protein